MPLFKKIVKISHSENAKKSKKQKPFNDLTAALAKEQAMKDMKKAGVKQKFLNLFK
jgi:hypothetical protein